MLAIISILGLWASAALAGNSNATYNVNELSWQAQQVIEDTSCDIKWLQVTDNSTRVICHNDSRLLEIGHGDGLTKRQYNVPLWYTAYQIAQKGTWWSSWEQASACNYCAGDPGSQFSLSFTYQNSIGWSGSIGFDIVSGLLSSEFSWDVEQTFGWSSSANCNCPGNSPVCAWIQTLNVWTNSQSQACCAGIECGGQPCGPWSAFQHNNMHSTNTDPAHVQLGCSSGSGCSC